MTRHEGLKTYFKSLQGCRVISVLFWGGFLFSLGQHCTCREGPVLSICLETILLDNPAGADYRNSGGWRIHTAEDTLSLTSYVSMGCAFPSHGKNVVAFSLGQGRVELCIFSFAILVPAADHHEST